ncbi:MAG TPA: hypothetical protein PLY01_07975 [Caldisericia bacterium]|nr:hypothetical protein [Caldisericia bacterium]
MEGLGRKELEQQLKTVNEQIAQKIPIQDFMDHFQQSKADIIRSYLQQGVPAEVTAIHTNVPVETVLAIGSGQEATKWMKYTDPAMVFDQAQRSIVFKTTRPKLNIAQQQAALQQQNLTDLDFLLKQSFYMQSQSKLFDGIRGYFQSDDFSLLRSLLRDKLEYVTNSRLGAKFFTDSGFATRDMEEIAAVATQLGQTAVKLHTNANKQMMSMLGSDLLVTARDTASVIEHNIALKVYNSIPGKVIYEDGKFFYPDPADAKKLIQATYEGTAFEIKTPAVKTLFDNYIALGRDFFEQENTRRSILGLPKMSDRGAWIPAYNPNNKHIAYAINPTTQETNVLIGKTAENLEETISAYRHANADHHIIRHGSEQEFYNKLKGRSDPMFISSANIHMAHGGASSAARVSSSTEELMDIVSAYDHLLNRNIKTSFELMLSDVMTKLDDMSSFTQAATKNQPLLGAKMFEKKAKDAAMTIRNTLLANNEMKNAPSLWKGTNETFEYLAEKTLTTIQDIFSPLIGKQRHTWTEKHYDQVIAELQKRNIPNVFQNFPPERAKELFHVDQTQRVTPLAPQTLVLANTAAATSLLRVGEIAHAYTNAIAYPILVTSKLSENMPKSFAGVARNADPLTPARNIIEGFLFTHSDAGRKALQDAAERGYITIQFSEADELFQSLRNIQGGAIAKSKEILSSHVVDLLSKATTWSEEAVRKWAYGTGFYVAQKYYPGITESGKRMYARQFMDQVIGNYTSAQRPTMFQGTLGMAMGLFQTYMVTMVQRLYGHLEKREFKALTKMMLAQTGIFGAHSLPGFQQVSNMIGEHFSDQNYDLISGTYRALPGLADYIIYGLPSSLGPSIYSRGDIQPRIPNPSQGFDMIPAVNLTHQALNTMVNVAKAVPNGSQAVLEALSLQSISRPLARVSELLNGYSITSTGQVLQKPEDVWTFTSIASRIMGARPLQDAKLRDMWHLNSMYGAMDRERRSSYTEKLRTHLRAGDIDANIVSNLAEEYMRTGTPTGWNSIVNTALAQTMLPTQSTIRNHFQPDSPHMRVLEDMW